MAKSPNLKFYVVWEGRKKGIYLTWEECKEQIQEFNDAKYKSFPTFEEAEKAFNDGYRPYIKSRKLESVNQLVGICLDNSKSPLQEKTPPTPNSYTQPKPTQAWAVDAACSGNPGLMEYRGVNVATGELIFHKGPFKMGTNNIGEFLAIVHGLALMKQQGISLPLYSDSIIAINWVRNKECKTKLPTNENTAILHELVSRALNWLKNNTYTTPIYKWDTASWGEIPADFGRKQ